MKRFSARVVAWQRQHGRHGLPWQAMPRPVPRLALGGHAAADAGRHGARRTTSASSRAFPTCAHWRRRRSTRSCSRGAGLGYYSARAQSARAARAQSSRHTAGASRATPPRSPQLPGIGRSTAAAIAAFCFDRARGDPRRQRQARARASLRGRGRSGACRRRARLWEVAERELPDGADGVLHPGLMDLGATLCTRTAPDCAACPVRATCTALRDGRVDELPERRRARPFPFEACIGYCRCGRPARCWRAALRRDCGVASMRRWNSTHSMRSPPRGHARCTARRTIGAAAPRFHALQPRIHRARCIARRPAARAR